LENETIETVNFDYISKCYAGSQDAHAVVRAFRILRNQLFFKNIEQDDYVIWADCGTHFRNSLIMGYLFKELKNSNKHGNTFILIFVLTNLKAKLFLQLKSI
jgi:hypothetical protein